MNALQTTLAAIGWSLLTTVVVGTFTSMAGITLHPAVAAIQGAAPRLVVVGVTAGGVLALTGRTTLATALLVAGFLWGAFLHVGTDSAKDAPTGTDRLRVLSTNLLLNNDDAAAVAADITKADPDVLITVETSETMRAGLTRHLAGYVEVSTGTGPRGAWATIWEHERVAHRRSGTTAAVAIGASLLPAATYRLDGDDVEIVAVHLHAPSSQATLPLWTRELDELTAYAETSGRRLIMAGDFNAGHAHPALGDLLDVMHDTERTPWGTGKPTWPVLGRAEGPYRLLPPLLDLDHILSGPGVGVSWQRSVRIHGSDHLGLVAEVGVVSTLPTSPTRPRS